mmetsp:Transcript_2620/g.4971  ORF Transcript_2620/g.4971 Transcript_2620/m.4971 type:complete len:234 (-) Transcript_2620:3-704(-)
MSRSTAGVCARPQMRLLLLLLQLLLQHLLLLALVLQLGKGSAQRWAAIGTSWPRREPIWPKIAFITRSSSYSRCHGHLGQACWKIVWPVAAFRCKLRRWPSRRQSIPARVVSEALRNRLSEPVFKGPKGAHSEAPLRALVLHRFSGHALQRPESAHSEAPLQALLHGFGGHALQRPWHRLSWTDIPVQACWAGDFRIVRPSRRQTQGYSTRNHCLGVAAGLGPLHLSPSQMPA